MSRAIKLLLLNAAVCLGNIAVFSKAFLGLAFSGAEPLVAAFLAMWAFLSVAVFLYGNYRLLYDAPPPPAKPSEDRFATLGGCSALLAEYIKREGKSFDAPLENIKSQIDRMAKKEGTVTGILLQKFSATELSFKRFQGQIDGVKKILCQSARAVLNRLYAFDENEYEKSLHSRPDDRHSEAKRALLKEYRDFLAETIDYNEEILLKMDRLILELSKLNDPGELNNLDALHEIDTLIGSAKWYK